MSAHLRQLEIDWEQVVVRQMEVAERHFGFKLILDLTILAEIVNFTNRALDRQYPAIKPNVAKIAGMFTFWLRKLKPISFPVGTKNKYLAVNEFVALMVGLAICEEYKDNFSAPDFSVAKIENRLLQDWVNGLRAHSHSPHGTIMSFELITANAKL